MTVAINPAQWNAMSDAERRYYIASVYDNTQGQMVIDPATGQARQVSGGGTALPTVQPASMQSMQQAYWDYANGLMGFAEEMTDWSIGMFEQQLGMIEPIMADLQAYAGKLIGWSDADRAHYESVFKPLETALAREAENFNTASRRELEAGRAQADVSSKFHAERQAAQRRLESMGVDPSEVRSGAIDSQMRMAEAAAEAGAANEGRRYVEQVGRELREQAIGVGQANANRALQETQLAGQFQEAAGQLGNAAYANAPRLGALPYNYLSLAGDALGGALGAEQDAMRIANQNRQFEASRRDDRYKDYAALLSGALAAYKKPSDPDSDDTSSQGWGALASGLGSWLGNYAQQFADGGSPDGPVNGPGGPKDDLVGVRVSPGEYISDADTVRWFGEKHFAKLREKAAEEMKREQAINPPQVGPAIPTGG